MASRMSVFFLLLIGATILPTGDAVLAAVGFGTGGVIKGTVAAAWQSSIGNVAAGSTFATLQSMGATAALSNPITAGVVVVGAAAYYLFG